MTPGISTGPNSRPLDDTIAETGPGIPDDAVGEGQLQPGEMAMADADRVAEALRERGWVGGEDASDEAEAHPS